MAVVSLADQTWLGSNRQFRNVAELLRDAQHSAVLCPSAHASATEELKTSSSKNNLVSTELGQEVPKGTSRNMMLHHKKFQHFIARGYLAIIFFDKIPSRSLVKVRDTHDNVQSLLTAEPNIAELQVIAV